jgi:hypothetical protein
MLSCSVVDKATTIAVHGTLLNVHGSPRLEWSWWKTVNRFEENKIINKHSKFDCFFFFLPHSLIGCAIIRENSTRDQNLRFRTLDIDRPVATIHDPTVQHLEYSTLQFSNGGKYVKMRTAFHKQTVCSRLLQATG